MSEIALTALVITYNHEAFIEEALDGVLMQETDFPFEVIISEDCSTDGTRAIIERYAREHPDRIRLMLSERNLNDNSVARRGLEAARGRYVALLDGDDAWTAKHKLQTQFDFLESRPDCSMCFHDARVVYDDGRPSHPFLETKPKPLSTIEDIVYATFIPTCSAVLRTEYLRRLPAWYDGLASGDRPLHVFAAEHGYLAYIDEVMADYRIHAGGVWTMRAKLQELADVEAIVEVYDAIDEHLGFRYKDLVDRRVADVYRDAAEEYYERGHLAWARTCARRALSRASARRMRTQMRLRGLLLATRIRALRRA